MYLHKNFLFKALRECCKATRLLIFATILQASFDQKEEVFLSLDKLPQQSLSLIRHELENITKQSIEQKSNVKTTSFGVFTVAKKSEVQDLLDSILKITYPYISQDRKLTDMTMQLESDDPNLKFSLLPEALPLGFEDKVPIVIGIRINEHGHKSAVKVNVWRDPVHVCYEYNDQRYCKPIFSYSEPVNMEDAECGTPRPIFTLSATGGAGDQWPRFPGDYLLSKEECNGRPVYNHGGHWLYSQKDGTWAVLGNWWADNDNVNVQPVFRSTTAAVCPTLCQKWEFKAGGFFPGDITVTCTIDK